MLPSKQVKALQDLGQKKMSIEKSRGFMKQMEVIKGKKANVAAQSVKPRVVPSNKDAEEGPRRSRRRIGRAWTSA